jgi:hypothetical protein
MKRLWVGILSGSPRTETPMSWRCADENPQDERGVMMAREGKWSRGSQLKAQTGAACIQ